MLRGDEHVGHLVLQRLERADRDAELFARLEIIQSRLIQRIDDADGLGAQRRDRPIHRPLDDGQGAARLADQRIGADGDILQ